MSGCIAADVRRAAGVMCRTGRVSLSVLCIALCLCVAPPLRAQDNGLLSLPQERPVRGLGWPALSPDGKQLCFTYLGNLWTVPSAGGSAIRLTVHESLDAYPRWSPDGRFIAFTSFRSGNPDVFIVPAEGGEARQVTYSSGSDWVNDWSPDGKQLLFYGNGRDTKDFSLFTLDLRNRALKRVIRDDSAQRFGTWSHSGKLVAYSRGGQPWWRPWYRGSAHADVVVADLTTGKAHPLLKTNTQQFWPHFSYDDRTVYMATVLGGNNTPNLYAVPTDGGTARAITHYTSDAVRYPDIARDGSLLTYLYNGDCYTVRPDGSGVRKLTIYVRTDDKVNNEENLVLHDHVDESELSPDGHTLALVLRGAIWTVSVGGGDAVQLTPETSNNADINWSPDGSKLVLISDRDNQTDVYTMDIKTKAVTRITNDPVAESNPTYSPDGKYISYVKAGAQPGLYVSPAAGGPARRLAAAEAGLNDHAWSPDSRWVAFSRQDRYDVTDIWVIPAVGGTAVDVTRYPDRNFSPQFTHDGRYLLFLSDRAGPAQLYRLPLLASGASGNNTAEVKIDFDRIEQRADRVNLPGFVDDFAPAPDAQHIIAHADGNFWGAGTQGGPPLQLTGNGEPGHRIEFLPDGSRFFYIGPNGIPSSIGLPPNQPGPPARVAFAASMTFDRRELHRQAFRQFYRQFGAGFYDPNLNGVDWPTLRAKYEPLLQGVGTSFEFANLLSEMVGEVNSSHSEISAAERPFGPQTATLGLEYDDTYTGPGLRITHVMPQGPADQPKARVHTGDYLLAVDGKEVSFNENYYQTLQDKAGKEMTLLVNNRPSKEGAHTLTVKPIGIGQWGELEYEARVQRRREIVDRLSRGRLAYIHIPAMDPPSMAKFKRELYTEAIRKEGLVLDIRGNGGGNTHEEILDALSRHVYGYIQVRDRLRQTQPARAFLHPVTLLIDQSSYSDAEVFPAAFRDMKLGKIVGMTTPGYVIGTHEGKLIDGTGFRIPEVGFFSLHGKNLENLGIAPDITVENTPDDSAKERDRQLEVAVKTLLHELPTTPDKTALRSDSVTLYSSANTNPNGGSSTVPPGRQPSRGTKP